MLCDEKEVRKRWREYFASLLQGEEVQQNVHRNARGEEEQVEMAGHERISMEEVCSSIWRLKNGKVPGSLWGHWRNVEGWWSNSGTVATQNHRLDMEEWECSNGLAEASVSSLALLELGNYWATLKIFTWPCATAAQLQGVERHCQSLLLKSAEI